MAKKMLITVDVDYFPETDIGVHRILDLFEKKRIKGTFFVAGRFAEDHRGVLKRIRKKGHEIGSHGYTHGIDMDENFIEIEFNKQLELLRKSTQRITDVVGGELKLFRAPFGKANCETIKALEELGYECDSSVTSLRFDFGMGVSNNTKALFAPRKPYFPSPENIFKHGGSKILEVPMSAFIFPLTLSAIRVMGLGKLKTVFRFAEKAFDPVVFYLHPWEVMEVDEIRLWQGAPSRHYKGRGAKALDNLDAFLEYANKRVEYSTMTHVLKEYI
jgi:peptidoglycan/xylan/chitin deacetylase (PgdA/CDA1 family)